MVAEEKRAALSRGLVRAAIRAGVSGGSAYGVGRALSVAVKSRKRKQEERQKARTRAAFVGVGAATMPHVVDIAERAALRVIKVAGPAPFSFSLDLWEEGLREKTAKVQAPRYLLRLLRKAVDRRRATDDVIRRAGMILRGKPVSLPPLRKAPRPEPIIHVASDGRET